MTEPFVTDPQEMDTPAELMVETDHARLTPSASDTELIAAARVGDGGAYAILYERHALAARRLARQIVQPVDVEDVVAETFMRVLSTLRRGLGPAAAFRPYLLTAVRRRAIDVLCGQRRQTPTNDADLQDPGEPFEDPAIASSERSAIARAFLSLPDRRSAVPSHTLVDQ